MNTICGRHFAHEKPIALHLENGVIAAMEERSDSSDEIWLAPGFIDLQLNGYGGYDFNRDSWTRGESGPDAPRAIAQLLARSGTTSALPTIVTSTRESILSSLRGLSQTLETDAELHNVFPFVHLEGPYISGEDGARGAHPLSCVRDPDWNEFQKFQEAARGRIKIVTLAPERDGALQFIERAVESGVCIAIGHTAATPAQIRNAVSAGASLSTHLGNGSHAMLPRHENYLWQQLAEDELTACLIADGHHLPPALVKIMARAKGVENLCLVSDAVALGGKPPGLYDDGRHEVLESGRVNLAGTPFLAGAGHLLDVCVANALRWTELGLGGVIKTVTQNPARVLGLHGRGELAVGQRADIVAFRTSNKDGEPPQILETWRAGESVYRAPQSS